MRPIRQKGQHQSFGKILQEKISWILRRVDRAGKCIEGREFIIALPESFVQYRADDVLRLFTETFHKRYDVGCTAALHHNKTKTNYHIHLVFSERKYWNSPKQRLLPEICFMMRRGNIDAQRKRF